MIRFHWDYKKLLNLPKEKYNERVERDRRGSNRVFTSDSGCSFALGRQVWTPSAEGTAGKPEKIATEQSCEF